jgi:hypothetical protein
MKGSLLGFFLGILTGGGAVISSFVSCGVEKKLSKKPEQFGKGAIADKYVSRKYYDACLESSPHLLVGQDPENPLSGTVHFYLRRHYLAPACPSLDQPNAQDRW